MKTIILCGGTGYRLKEETEFKPKPMVAIGNKPILWHIMKIYASYGFNDFILALGYKGDYIKQYFLNQKQYMYDFTLDTKHAKTKFYKNNTNETNRDDFHITFVDTGWDTLPGERILKLKKYIPESDDFFMVTYGDGLSDINIQKLLKFHKQQKTIGTITGVNPRSKFPEISFNKKNIALSFREKPVLNALVNGGFMIFNRSFFSYLKENEFEHDALRRLIHEGQLSLFIHTGFWHAMDTYADVENLNNFWNTDPKWKVW